MKLQHKFSKITILSIIWIFILFFSCTNDSQNNSLNNNKSTGKSILNSFNDSVSYSLGVVVGNQMKMYGIKELDYQKFLEGLKQTQEDGNTQISSEVAQMIVNTYVQRTYNKKMVENKEIKDDFFSKNAKKQGVVNLTEGFQYKIIKQGSGKIPDSDNEVVVNFRGQLLDGSVFSNTFGQNPAKFVVRNSLKGWQMALTNMKEGSVWEIYLAPQYAFGNKSTKKVPPNSIVVYTLELVSVK